MTNAGSITANSTITLTENSTRPQSVWYTVSASGQTADSGSTAITQSSYQLTSDENNNIFAITSGKIAGALSNGQGGVGSSNGNQPSTNVYTTAVGGTQSGVTNPGTPVQAPTTTLQTGTAVSSRATNISYHPIPKLLTTWHY